MSEIAYFEKLSVYGLGKRLKFPASLSVYNMPIRVDGEYKRYAEYLIYGVSHDGGKTIAEKSALHKFKDDIQGTPEYAGCKTEKAKAEYLREEMRKLIFSEFRNLEKEMRTHYHRKGREARS